jgi:hypothetical protein
MGPGNALKGTDLEATLRPTMSRTPPSLLVRIAELERRIKWSAAGVFMFVGLLSGLAVLAVLAAITPVRSVNGLPDDRAVRAARVVVAGHVRPATGDLRFASALFEGGSGPPLSPAAAWHLLDEADSLLEGARLANLAEPRIPAFQGHLALARRRYPAAERLYRHAIDLGAHTSEARLGLGLALALRSELASDQREARALLLAAIAQFAAVREDAPAYEAALYDRALLLARAGRRGEAARFAREYLARDSTSGWAERLRRELAG